MDAWIIKETCIDRQYERMSVDIEDGWTVVDIGAALGDFAIQVAKNNPRCSVYALEPFPESFSLLCENLELNGVTNVTPLPYAVSGQSGNVRLTISSSEPVQHSTSVSESSSGVLVTALSLDSFFAENGIEICDFLKADCEGAEYDILLKLGASSLGRIRHLCIEYHDHVGPHNHLDLVHHLQAHGFEVRCSQNPVHSNLGLLYARNQRLNAVSRPEESHGTNSNRPEGSLQ